MAHFALGYTLYELGRFRESYAHLRHYAELAPLGSWNWCWLGKAAAAIGETAEAERAYRRAIELTKRGDRRDRRRRAARRAVAGRRSDRPRRRHPVLSPTASRVTPDRAHQHSIKSPVRTAPG